MGNYKIFLLGVLSVFGVAAFALNTLILPLQNEILTRAERAISEKGINSVKLTVVGRDIQISGVAPTNIMQDELVLQLQNLEGVRQVSDSVENSDRLQDSLKNGVLSEQTYATKKVIEQNNQIKVEILNNFTPSNEIAYLTNAPIIETLNKTDTKNAPVIPSCHNKVNDILRSNPIVFNVDSNVLKDSAIVSLDKIGSALKLCSFVKMVIYTHTDSFGLPDKNLLLSQLRATTLKDYFYKLGIEAFKIDAIGKGETEPLALNDTPEGRALNRRVEIIVK